MAEEDGRPRRDRMALERFLRTVLNEALETNPEAACVKPELGSPRPHPLSERIVRVLAARGYELRSTIAWKHAHGARRRMELEDLITMTLVAVPAKVIVQAAMNVQARDTLTSALCDTFRSKRVVLFRPRR